MGKYKRIREEAYKANMELKRQGLVISTFGNVSAADVKGRFFSIKPSGVPYEKLSPSKMVVVSFDNKILEGNLRPSSDTETHAVIYSNFKGIAGITHTHSPYAVAWAQAKKSIPVLGTTHADYSSKSIPCTKPLSKNSIRGKYETETGVQIVKHFKKHGLNYNEIQMVLVACHGPFTWGSSAGKSVMNNLILEKIAEMAYMTLKINPECKPVSKELINKHYTRKHGKKAYYGQ
ncbi:MAG: L-ribulose-5-phosphate 4-epimerase [Candidatus Firestonebacteria bacterium RIFOXYA2_FULL_40_8]|nr:MAG: L-ribulose-5-phosphate 4-epimerase [Candidatus Firestonebacteria bacterium RIFOXYA2_FULL_40_8]